MSKNVLVQYLSLSLIMLGAIVGFVYLFQNYHSLLTRAQENSLTLKIKLQGESYPQATTKTYIVLYNAQGKVKEFNDVIFTYGTDKTFEGVITFDPSFDYNALYAIFIKPKNYFGQLFCSGTVTGKNCTWPQFIIKQSGSLVDLSKIFFYGGDIDPANGIVDAYDISRIMSNLGKSNDSSTDINNDGMTNSIDYLLALYSLGNNLSDDAITLIAPSLMTPSASGTPIPTSALSPATPTPTSTPALNTAPSPMPTIAPSPIPSATRIPVPTSTTVPAPTSAPVGVCKFVNPLDGSINDVPIGASRCSCSKVGFISACAQVTCKACSSANSCECKIKASLPSTSGEGDSVPCSNGGVAFIKGVSGC